MKIWRLWEHKAVLERTVWRRPVFIYQRSICTWSPGYRQVARTVLFPSLFRFRVVMSMVFTWAINDVIAVS